MIEKRQKMIGKLEEAIEFYNRVLALDNDEVYIINLVKKLSQIFISKINMGCCELCFLNEDLEGLSDFERSCMKFFQYAKINLCDGGFIMIDECGTIISFGDDHTLEKETYCGKNIFDYLNRFSDEKAISDAINVINQNIFSSKLYLAVSERLSMIISKDVSGEFLVINRTICTYADKMGKNDAFRSTQMRRSRTQSTK